MRIIKRLDGFVLKSFVPLFAMTFFIVLFIVLMQFLWKYVDDLVGKGLELKVIAELFFYAAVSMVPMSLPLAILLASLMTFGNLGEKFELTAMKASGISLLRVMAPLIVLVGTISIGAFFFQNNVLPPAQVKMWTLLFSMKQKSPEVEIPEGVFYDQIPGYNLYVGHKNRDNGTLCNVMIYDVSRGGENATILLADTARMAFTKDSRYLYLHLIKGEQFENLREMQASDINIPFRREEFADKQILIPFDMNFNRMDDEGMRKQYVGKNIAELRHTIDSVNRRVDSVGADYGRELMAQPYAGVRRRMDFKGVEPLPIVASTRGMNLDTLLNQLGSSKEVAVIRDARIMARNKAEEYQFKSLNMADDLRSIRRHEIELVKKFTLSVACLIMFFIGAPLGAIIKKGGLGTPLVISVLLFLVYYIIDNTGYKMARDGRWPVYFGMWVSTMALTPLGVFATYKAMNDSALFDSNTYRTILRKILGLRQKRGAMFKEVIINDVDLQYALNLLNKLTKMAQSVMKRTERRQGYYRYLMMGLNGKKVESIAELTDFTVDYLSDCNDKRVVALLEHYPIIDNLWAYHPSLGKKWLGWLFVIVLPVGLLMWSIGLFQLRRLNSYMADIITLNEKVTYLL